MAEYKRVLALDPDLVEARVNLGLTYHALGEYQLAILELERALQTQPNLFPGNLFLGIEYAKLGPTSKAVPFLRRALQTKPSDLEARSALARCLLSQGDYRGAAEQLRTLFTLEPDKQQAWYSLGHSYLEMVTSLIKGKAVRNGRSAWTKRLAGDLQAEGGGMSLNDAVSSYRQALAVEPSQPGLHAQLGRVYLRESKVEAAEQQFRSELELDSLNEEALIGLAEVNLAKGDAISALRNTSKLWAVYPPFLAELHVFPSIGLLPELVGKLTHDVYQQPDSPARSFLLSALYGLAGDTKRRQEQLSIFETRLASWQSLPTIANSRESSDSACHSHRYKSCVDLLGLSKNLKSADRLLLGKAYFRLQQPVPASDGFASALGRDSNNLEAMYWLVRAYIKLANDCFTELTRMFPDSWRVHELRGEDYRVRIDYADAIKEYQIAASLKPNAAELHENLADLYLSLHEKPVAEAKAELEKALDLDPSRAHSLYLCGKIYLMERKYETAIPVLKKALRFEPDLLEAHAGLGRALLRIGNPELAVRELEIAANTDYYGDLHYQLYEGYRQLGKAELAQRALIRSQELRKESVANQMAKVESVESE